MTDVSGEVKERLDKHSARINEHRDRLIRAETKIEGIEDQVGRISDNVVNLQAQQAENHKETTTQLGQIHSELGKDAGRREGIKTLRGVHLAYGGMMLTALALLARIAWAFM